MLRATEELLAEGASYADLHIERIATRAGISRTAFYFYFRDRRELLMRLTGDVAEQIFAHADTWYSGSGDPAQRLAEALAEVAATYREHGDVLRAIVEVSAYDEQVAGFWHGVVDRFVAATRARIEAEAAAGRSDVADPGATAFALCWMTERALNQQVVQGDPVVPEALEQAMIAIWRRGVYGCD